MTALLLFFCFLVSAGITYYFSQPNARGVILDHPSDRSLHHTSISRNGGQAIFLSICLGILGMALQPSLPPFDNTLFLAMLVIAAISYSDDRCSLSPLLRLMAHGITAGLLVTTGFQLTELSFPTVVWPLSNSFSVVISMLFIVWMINLYNFMDGLDGLAGGMALIGFGWISLQAVWAGEYHYALFSAIIVSSSLGFLIFNLPPARIFMGDLGSSLLGFFASALILWGIQHRVFFLWQALLVFSPFIADATLTLLRRIWHREKIWQAHRQHYYQRLVLLGWSQKRTLGWEYGLMLSCAISASIAPQLSKPWQWAIVVSGCSFYLLPIYIVHYWEQTQALTPAKAQ